MPRNEVTVDAIALISTSVLTAGSGLIFWAIAARLLSPHDLGFQAASLSLITTIGTVAAIGTCNAFTALLPSRDCHRSARLRDGYVMVFALSVALASAAAVSGVGAIGHRSIDSSELMVVGGSMTMAFFALKDSALVGLGRARQLPVQNLAVSLAKLAILPFLAVTVSNAAVMATVLPAAVATVLVSGLVIPRILARSNRDPLISWDASSNSSQRRESVAFATRDGMGSVMTLGLVLALPFITTSVAGPVQGAVLGLVLPISQGLDLVAVGIGTALTANLSKAPSAAVGRVRKACVVTVPIAAVGAATLIALSPVLVSIFGTERYGQQGMGVVLAVLLIGAVVRVPYVMWASLLRAQRRTARLLIVNASAFAVTLPLIILLCGRLGALGASLGLAVGSLLLGCIATIGILHPSELTDSERGPQ